MFVALAVAATMHVHAWGGPVHRPVITPRPVPIYSIQQINRKPITPVVPHKNVVRISIRSYQF